MRHPWDKYFGVLSLLCVVEAKRDYARAVEYLEQAQVPRNGYLSNAEIQGAYLLSFARHVATAMEAVGYAEILSGRDPLIASSVQIARSSHARKAAQARHEPVRELKADFRAYYTGRRFKSKAAAAERFLESLTPEKKRLLSPTNAVRTLVESLRE